MIVQLAHILAFVPLFLYVGIVRESTPDLVFNILGAMGLIILGYHLYRAFGKLKENKSAWVNWIHIFLVAPLLLILAYLKKDAARRYFEMLLILAFAALGYHAFYLIREMIFS